MRRLKRQAGYGTLAMMILLGLLAVGSTVYHQTRMQQLISVRETYDSTAEELREITSALMAYYRDNMAWPSTMNELAASGYFTGDAARCGGGGAFQSPFCTTIFGGQVGDDYRLTVNLLQESVAQAVANQISGGASVGTTVTATINRPFQSALYENYLQRVADPDDPQRTQLTVDLDINHNDLVNIGSLNVQTATLVDAELTHVDIDRVNTELVQLGNNRMTYVGDQLDITADAVNLTNGILMNGNIVGNGNNITGMDSVKASTGDFDSVSSDSAVINSLSGNSMIYKTGSVEQVSGNQLTFDNGTITKLGGNTLTYNTGTIQSVTGNNVKVNNGNINLLSGSSLSYDSGTMQSLSGNTLTYTAVNATNGHFDAAVSANSGDIGNMSVSGLSGFNKLTSSNSYVANLDVTLGHINTGEVNVISGKSMSSSGLSTLDELESKYIDSNSVTGQTVNASSGSVSDDVSAGKISVSNLSASHWLETNAIESTFSSVGYASSSQLTVLGALSASTINTAMAKLDSGTMTNIGGTIANYNKVTASQFTGGGFTSKDDFYTPQSSVNNNYLLITEQKNKLDNCMYVTQHCLPETPSVNVSCSTCIIELPRSDFSGSIMGSITDCRQGCSYSWVTSGSGLSFSGCSSGTIAKGGSATPLCKVSSWLEPQQSASGSIKLVVTNSHYTNYTASDSVSVFYMNTSPNDPFKPVLAGCYVVDGSDNSGLSSTCYGKKQGEGSAVFSVGDHMNAYKDSYLFSSKDEWSVNWSGDCQGSDLTCTYVSHHIRGTDVAYVTAEVTHNPTNQTKDYQIKAWICVYPEGEESNC